jgi:hypothetical protein
MKRFVFRKLLLIFVEKSSIMEILSALHKRFLLCVFVLFSSFIYASNITQSLSGNAKISLLTSSPYDEEIYTLYGHTAIRIKDDSVKRDLVFNYGIFDFSKPNFIYRFAKGETYYKLDIYNFKRYIVEYQEHGSEVYEQILNLLPEEKEALWQALALNALPENQVYRYNFFFDNCATRPIAIIEKNINGTIHFQGIEERETFRHAINYLTQENKWLTLGCDLVLGLQTDRTMTQKERLFLPENLKNYLSNSVIIREKTSQPLVAATNVLMEQRSKPKPKPTILFSPLIYCCILFTILLIITSIECILKKYFKMADCILFFIAGIAGCIIFFLSFFSVHPCIFPNINLLWLHPLHLIGVIFFSLKKYKKPAFWYHFINFAVIFAMCVIWFFISQHFNIAFIPLIASFLLRSGGALLRKKLLIE